MRSPARAFALALIASSTVASGAERPVPATGLDHILVGAPDLDRAVAQVERRTGVRAVYGGSHPGVGTRNALIALGNGAYLEIIAPDPKQPKPSEFSKFVGSLKTMTPLGWAYHTANLDALRSALRSSGVHVERIEPGSRKRPDGRTLRWRTFEIGAEEDVSPFFIEWGKGTPHPSLTAARGCRLAQFTVGGPLKPNIVRALALTKKSAVWTRSAPAGLHVALQCRRGTIRF
jgi:hypothetical protein